jgi:hypothetical protein
VADGRCWFVLREEYCRLVAGDWFVLREKYCWLVADKPSEQGGPRQAPHGGAPPGCGCCNWLPVRLPTRGGGEGQRPVRGADRS